MEATTAAPRLGKAGIERILPHRGRALLLDRVVMTAEGIRGELTVTEEVCEGHAVLAGKLVFRGSDLLDMAAQLLAVFVASQYPQHLGRTCLIREYGGAKFKAPIKPGEKIFIELATVDVEVVPRAPTLFITGKKFVVWDQKREEIKAEIHGVTLVIP